MTHVAKRTPMPERASRVPVSVIVTACTDSEALRASLRDITRQARALDGDCCLVVNTEEQRMPAQVRSQLGELVDQLLFAPEPGKSNALNAAIAQVQGEIVAFTDDDATPSPSWLESLLAAFDVGADGDPRPVAGVGGPVLPVFPAEGVPPWYRHFLGRSRSTFLGPKHHLGNRPLDYELSLDHYIKEVPLGANCAWRRRSLQRFPFRPELGPNRSTGMRGGEDTCLALEVMGAGGRVRYEPKARVYHPVDGARMTMEYALEGHRSNGEEYVKVMRALGRELPTVQQLEHTLQRNQLGPLARRVFGQDRVLRRRMRCEYCRAILAEGHGQ